MLVIVLGTSLSLLRQRGFINSLGFGPRLFLLCSLLALQVYRLAHVLLRRLRDAQLRARECERLLILLRLLEAWHHVAEHVTTERLSEKAWHLIGKWILVLRILLRRLHVWIHHLHIAIAVDGHHVRLSWLLRLRLELLLMLSSLRFLSRSSLLLSSEFFEAGLDV